jgi:CBS domain-containing protein
MDIVANVLDHKGVIVFTVRPDATILAAVQEMCGRRIGALLVCEGQQPVGIISERDLMNKVVLARRDPAATRVDEVMTTDVVCVSPRATIGEAMAIMTERHCRHLPVVDEGTLAGMVSIGDLVRWESCNQEHEIRMLTDYICGKYPG